MKQLIRHVVVGTFLLGPGSGCGSGEPKIVMPTARYPPPPPEGITVGGGSRKPHAPSTPVKGSPEELSPPAPEKTPP
jgi:hypothetical protein